MADLSFDIKRVLSSVASGAGRALFPPLCGGCRRAVSLPATLCGTCWREVKLVERPWCEVLGVPFALDMGEGVVSPAAIANPPPFDRARSAVIYSGVARRMVQSLKYNDRTDLAPWMARWMIRAGGELIRDADMIVPVPLHPRRFLLRRFNQSAELARAISVSTGLDFAPSLIVRTKRTRQQVGLGLSEREANVRGAFKVPPEMRTRLKGRRVLAVDDVYTTGATVSAMTRSLKRAGAAGVDVLTFARVLPEDFLNGGGDSI